MTDAKWHSIADLLGPMQKLPPNFQSLFKLRQIVIGNEYSCEDGVLACPISRNTE